MQNATDKKSLKKQLVAAIVMLLVAALALGTATYAWFVNNNTVTGTGASVKAQTESSLFISNSSNSGWGSTAAATFSGGDSLKPCTSYDGKSFGALANNVKVKTSSSAQATWNGPDGAFQASDIELLGDTTGYVAKGTYYLKYEDSVSTATKALTMTTTLPDTATSDIYRAMKVGVVVTKNSDSSAVSSNVFNPKGGTPLSEGIGKYSGSAWSLNTTSPYAAANTTLATMSVGTIYKVDISIWFEGQDQNCKTDNVSLADVTNAITFTFSVPN